MVPACATITFLKSNAFCSCTGKAHLFCCRCRTPIRVRRKAEPGCPPGDRNVNSFQGHDTRSYAVHTLLRCSLIKAAAVSIASSKIFNGDLIEHPLWAKSHGVSVAMGTWTNLSVLLTLEGSLLCRCCPNPPTVSFLCRPADFQRLHLNKMFAKLSRDPKTLQRQRHAVQSWPKYPLSNSAASLANAPSRVHLEECSQIRQVAAPFESHSQKDVKEGQVAPVRCPYHLLQIIWSDKKPAHSIPARVKFASECTQQASQASQDIFPPLTARPWSDSLSVSSAPITPVSDLPTGETHPIPLYRLVHACVPSSAMIIPIKPGSIQSITYNV